MRENQGIRPKARRVHVILRSGYDTRSKEPAGWPVETTDFRQVGSAFDVEKFEVIE